MNYMRAIMPLLGGVIITTGPTNPIAWGAFALAVQCYYWG